MSYVDDHLLNGERVIHRTSLHPLNAYGPPIFFLIVGAVLGAIFGAGIDAAAGGGLFLVFVAVAAVALVGGLVRLNTTEFAITDRRVIAKAGWLSRNSIEINLAKVEGLQVQQDPIARLFDYGNVIVTGTGGTHEPFKGLRDPMALRRAVQERLDQG